MRHVPLRLLAILVLVCCAPAARASADPMSVPELAAALGDPKLVLLHVGTQASYSDGHIRTARHALLMDLHASDGLSFEMLPPERLRQQLQALGISDDSKIVVYPAAGALASAGRLITVLDYAGLTDVRLLKGGLVAWKAAGQPVTTDAATPRQGTLKPLRTRPVVVEADFVREHAGKPGFAVVDARARSFYDGIEKGGSISQPHPAGHVPRALSLPFNTVSVDDALKPAGELRQLFAAAGVKEGDVVVAYCHIGLQANAVLLAARELGHRVLLYDGSFEDWARRGLPVDGAAVRGR